MKLFKNDVALLFIFLLLFCFGLSFLHNDQENINFIVSHINSDINIDTDVEVSKKNPDIKENKEKNSFRYSKQYRTSRTERLSDLSTDQLMKYMSPLFMTRSASSIISFLKHIPSASVYRIVEAIVKDRKIHLPPRVKVRIIFAGAERQCSRKSKSLFFDLLVGDRLLKKGAKPILVKAVEAGYSHLVHDILAWSRHPEVGDISMEALLYAVRHDDEDPESLRELFEAGVNINRFIASKLLGELVGFCSEGYSVSFLVRGLQADPNYIIGERTVLMEAVKMNKTPIVFELLKNGANPTFKMLLDDSTTAVEMAKLTNNEQMKEVFKLSF